MPVTVKFSEQFYRKLGHEVVDEMVNWFNQADATYRGDLRELNELNFARFDAKLEQRVAQLDAKLELRLSEVKAELRQEIESVRVELRTGLAGVDKQLADQRAALVKWMFAFWVAQAGLTVGLVLLVVRR